MERKERINAILKGKLGGDWQGFDSGKMTQTDPSVSVKEEAPLKVVSETLSEADSIEKMDSAIQELRKESERLEARLVEIGRVKDAFDAKELESRKETCTPCSGTGKIKCARCKGDGAIIVKANSPCPTCSGGDDDSDEGAFGAPSTAFGSPQSVNKGKGKVCKEVSCRYCKGQGGIRRKCSNCNGNKSIKLPDVPGRLVKRHATCPSCNGSGLNDPEECPKCSGTGKMKVWQPCPTCRGTGVTAQGNKETCPVCKGKGELSCERCDGRGFVYRSKDDNVTQHSNPKPNVQGDAAATLETKAK